MSELDDELRGEGYLKLETLIRHALARAYCAPCNSHKELDADLVDEMTKEVLAIPMFVNAMRHR